MSEDKHEKEFVEEDKSADDSAQDRNDAGSGEENEQKEQDIEALRQEAEMNREKFLRLAAEFENYKKRMERERSSMLKYAGENILRDILPSLDNLERAIEQASMDAESTEMKLEGLVEGVGLTKDGLLNTLEKFEVYPIDSVGKEFDPNEQEAMAMEASNEVPANHVLKEFVKGYRFKDRLLRAAKVIVSKGPE